MKKYTNHKPVREFKNMQSPFLKKKKCIFNKNPLKDLEINKLALSHKKSKDELLLTKKEIFLNKYHRRVQSNFSDAFKNMTSSDRNFAINSLLNQASLIQKKTIKKEKKKENKSNKIESISRNKNNNSILSISSSLKEFRNKIINGEKHFTRNNNNYLNNEYNLKNKSVIIFDNSNNIEETRNTTSINNCNTAINNSYLIINNKSLNKKEKEKKILRTKKNMKIKLKQNKKLNTSKDSNLKINNNNLNKKIFKDKFNNKYNLHCFIYRNTNKKPNKTYYLNSSQKSFRYSDKNLQNIKNFKKLDMNNSISEKCNNCPLSFINSEKKHKNDLNCSKISKKYFLNSYKNIFPSSSSNQKGKILPFPKYKKKNNNNKENKLKLKIYENEIIKEFESVEEIHFKFIEINQRKNEFFENFDEICKNK